MSTPTAPPSGHSPAVDSRGRSCARGGVRRVPCGDGGGASVELVVASPVVLLVLLAVVQFALWSHATHIAQAAASQGLSSSRVQGGSAAAGAASARQVLDQLGSGPLIGTGISSDRGSESASVRVTGTATPVIPFLTLRVYAEATGPIERF